MASKMMCGALGALVLWPASAWADVVTEWNEVLVDAQVRAAVGANPAPRALAIAHIAGFEAVNAITGRYEPYAEAPTPTLPASEEAAFVSAFYTASVALYPAEQATLEARYQTALDAIDDGPAKDNGIALGSAAAEAILTARDADGSAESEDFPGEASLGRWRPTPRADTSLEPLPAAQPFWRRVAPFSLDSGDQFRAAAPPALTSAEYASAYEEVRTLGGASSTRRSAEQTTIARFWVQATHRPFNQIARSLAERRSLALDDSARLFALLNIALADARIAVWDTKYEFGFWRPVTAIAEPLDDGNDATTPEPDWVPLLETPNHPAYASGHSATGAAGAEVLSAVFGERIDFDVTSPDVPDVRSFVSFADAAQENADSRIYGGIHWPFDNQAGLALGAEVGRHAVENTLLPIAGAPEPSASESSGCSLGAGSATSHRPVLLLGAGLLVGWLRRPRRSTRRVITVTCRS